MKYASTRRQAERLMKDSEYLLLGRLPASPPNWHAARARKLFLQMQLSRYDDAALFTDAMELIDNLTHLLKLVGDEDGSRFAASVARKLETKASEARRKKRRSPQPRG